MKVNEFAYCVLVVFYAENLLGKLLLKLIQFSCLLSNQIDATRSSRLLWSFQVGIDSTIFLLLKLDQLTFYLTNLIILLVIDLASQLFADTLLCSIV